MALCRLCYPHFAGSSQIIHCYDQSRVFTEFSCVQYMNGRTEEFTDFTVGNVRRSSVFNQCSFFQKNKVRLGEPQVVSLSLSHLRALECLNQSS
jgi:hypothetical protein